MPDTTLTPKQEARKMIAGIPDVPLDMEKLREILKREKDPIIEALVLAEAAVASGARESAIRGLREYQTKHQADRTINKTIGQALELAKSKKGMPYDKGRWGEIYDKYESQIAKRAEAWEH